LLRPDDKADHQISPPPLFERRNLPEERLSTFESVKCLLLIPNAGAGIAQDSRNDKAYRNYLVEVFQSKDFSAWLAELGIEDKWHAISNTLLIPDIWNGVSQCLDSDKIFRDNLLSVLKSKDFVDWLAGLPIENRRHAIGNLVSISISARMHYDSWGEAFVDAISLDFHDILHAGRRPSQPSGSK